VCWIHVYRFNIILKNFFIIYINTAAHQNHITKFVSILYTYMYTVINNYFLFLQSLNRYYWRGQWCWWWFWRWLHSKVCHVNFICFSCNLHIWNFVLITEPCMLICHRSFSIPRSTGRGEVYCFTSVVRSSQDVHNIFLSNYLWQQSDILS
jgi:hypothetical protein